MIAAMPRWRAGEWRPRSASTTSEVGRQVGEPVRGGRVAVLTARRFAGGDVRRTCPACAAQEALRPYIRSTSPPLRGVSRIGVSPRLVARRTPAHGLTTTSRKARARTRWLAYHGIRMYFVSMARGKYHGFIVPAEGSSHPLTERITASGLLGNHTTVDICVAVRGFFTDDDGELFRVMLSQLERIISEYMPPELRPSVPLEAHQILILFHNDGRIEIWINEGIFQVHARVRRDVNAGELAKLGDISDVEGVRCVGADLPERCGFASFTALHGNRCLVFDLRPTLDGSDGGSCGPGALLTASFTYILFRQQLSLTELEWQAMLEQGWFPFVCLDVETVGAMIQAMREAKPIDVCLPRITECVRSLLPEIGRYFSSHAVFDRHRAVIVQALAAYERRDYALANTALLVRAEGLLRDYYARGEAKKKPQQELYLNAIAQRSTHNPLSLLRPQRFADYLKSVVFAYEDFKDPATVTMVTRHSVSHGVADSNLLNEKFSTIALLCVYQLGILTSTT